jgi:predicted MFS family arabinose efflux permease
MVSLTPLVAALGIAQIISWGTLYYAVGVLGPAMRAELHVGELFLFGAFTAGLFVSGALAPLAGRLIDGRGGRLVLSGGSVLGALAMALLAVARHPAVMVSGWLVAGAAMAACLYDPAFATLSQHTGERYRRAVTALTLFGGFASTVFWPLSQLLMEAFGWRAAFAIYAAMHLLICLPIHRIFVPRHIAPSPPYGSAADRGEPVPPTVPRLKWLAACFALTTFIVGVVAVHMIGLLTTGGLTAAQAVAISMAMGPMQVLGRILELGFGRRVSPVAVGYISIVLMMVALVALIRVDGMGVLAIAFVTAYGFSNGLLTIVRGTIPAELFGRKRLGALLGYLSRASVGAKAAAPAAYSALLAMGFTRNEALSALVGFAAAALGTYAMATRKI